MTQTVDMERLARVWRKMQDARDELKLQFEAADKVIEDDQEQVGELLNAQMIAMKGDKLMTQAGEIVRAPRTFYNGADWGAVNRWAVENNVVGEIYEKRLLASFFTKYAKDNEALPPGVNAFTKFKVSVKKPGAKSPPVGD